MAFAGMSLEGRGEALGVRSEIHSFKLLLRHIPLQFTAQEAKLPKALVVQGARGGQGKVLPPCGHFL